MSKWRWSRFLTGSRPARRESPEAEAAARLHAPDAVSDLEVAKRPLERSILWLPAGWGEFERGEPQGYQIFVDQTVLREVAIHAGAGLEGAYGLFAGRVLACRATQAPFVWIQSLHPSEGELPEGEDLSDFRDFVSEMRLAAGRQGRRIVGWYHTHTLLGLQLSRHDRLLHVTYFPEAWSCALVVTGRGGKVEGGFFQRDRGEVLFQRSTHPFREVINQRVRAGGGPYATAVGWTNYRTSEPVIFAQKPGDPTATRPGWRTLQERHIRDRREKEQALSQRLREQRVRPSPGSTDAVEPTVDRSGREGLAGPPETPAMERPEPTDRSAPTPAGDGSDEAVSGPRDDAAAAGSRSRATQEAWVEWRKSRATQPGRVVPEEAASAEAEAKAQAEEKVQRRLAEEEVRRRLAAQVKAARAAQAEAEAKARAEEEARARAEAELKAARAAQAETEAKARAEEEARARAEAEATAAEAARAEAEVRARAEEEARARAEAEAKAAEAARAEAEAKVRAEEEARARAEAEAKAAEAARTQAEARARAEEEARSHAEAETVAAKMSRAEAEARARAEEEARHEAERAHAAAEAARVSAEAARAEAETKAKVGEEARSEAEAARTVAEAAQAQAELKAQAEEEARARADAARSAAEAARVEAEAKVGAQEAARADAEAEAKEAEAAQAEAEARARAEEEARAQAEAARLAAEAAQAKAEAKAAEVAQAEAEARARAEEEARARAEEEARGEAARWAAEVAEGEADQTEAEAEEAARERERVGIGRAPVLPETYAEPAGGAEVPLFVLPEGEPFHARLRSRLPWVGVGLAAAALVGWLIFG